MLPQEIIRKTRNREQLTAEEINFFIQRLVEGKIADIQAASFTMAVFLNGLNNEETLALTLAMRDSGTKLTWSELSDKPIVDKHSTGGVGDKISLMLAPMLAACGTYVPMIAGRGLGHTGGTLDKLDSIAGYKTAADTDSFKQTVKKVGCAIMGQTKDLAPADKKLAAGLQYLVMDIKCGNGAFMENMKRATELAHSIANVANGAGTKTTALLTDMNSVLGTTVGNALEVEEALNYLKGEAPDKRLDEVTMALCSELLMNSGMAKNSEEAEKMLRKSIETGSAYEKFIQMAVGLGADAKLLENFASHASYVEPIYSTASGYVAEIDTRKVGLGVILLGGGRTTPEQKINYTTGFTSFCQIGDKVDEKTPLCYVHAEDKSVINEVNTLIRDAVKISENKPEIAPTIIRKIA